MRTKAKGIMKRTRPMERIARTIWEHFRAGEDKLLACLLYTEYLVLQDEGGLYTMYGSDIRAALRACKLGDTASLSRLIEKIYIDYAYKGDL